MKLRAVGCLVLTATATATLLISPAIKAQPQQPQDPQALSHLQALSHPQQCERTAYYHIYLSGIRTGYMDRTESWEGTNATITSRSKASILGIGTQYDQQATLIWSEESDSWLTTSFHQVVSGFKSRDMKVSFSDDGSETRVDLDGEITEYQNNGEPLRDVDTLSVQIRQYVLDGDRSFALTRQATDGPEPYDYEVQDLTTIKVDKWGEIEVIPVKQTGAERVTFWYAPSLGYQLVKARYHGFLLRGGAELQQYESSCADFTVKEEE
ncbi:hypothetical protein [Vibrio crassostreae]|uniref:hypothetical protein n=1 Tax=Vibrio crassostreae TaxID=246167 RepID=UPI002009F5F1|nr:hypothetical protein [Vibrio crassostreae]